MTTLINLLHRCLLTPDDEAAFDTYRRAVARSGGDGQRVCAPARALVQSICAATTAHCHAPARRLRCCASFDHEPIQMESADWLIFIGSTYSKGKRISPTSAAMMRNGGEIGGLTHCIILERLTQSIYPKPLDTP